MNRRQLIPWRRESMPLSMIEETPVQSLWQEINRTFDDFFSEFGERPFALEPASFSPSVNVTESDAAFTVTAEVPGVAEDDIEVTLTQNTLTIKGEKKVEQKEEKEGYYHLERRFGSFSRSIPLPPNVVDQDRVAANFEKGVLTITLPKNPEAQQIMKRIPVKTG
ncbi:MAG: Hsp20/alpha crystallin family protein [Chloroflexota bacterium]